jgi:P-type Cu+ transporter
VVSGPARTLIEGRPRVDEVAFAPGVDQAATIAWVGAIEARSEHPLAAAITHFALARSPLRPAITAFEAIPGQGVRARVAGVPAVVGTDALLTAEGVQSGGLRSIADQWAADGRTPVLAAINGRAVAAFAIADTMRGNAREVVGELKALGQRVVMLTGDRQRTAESVAHAVGIDYVIAEVLPHEKVAAIKKLQAEGGSVAMIGDGLNDAPALAQADVGIAMAAATHIAAEAADVILMRNDLQALVAALRLARRTMATMKQNLFWAFIYNVIGIPIAAGALYPAFGVLLNPVIASAAMAFSSVSVVTNSLRLRRARLT